VRETLVMGYTSVRAAMSSLRPGLCWHMVARAGQK
jgi:hypothetical protein